MWYKEPTALEKNAAKNRGNAQEWFQHTADYSDPAPKARVRPEAQKIVDKHTASQIPFDPRAPLEAKLPQDEVHGLRVRGEDAVANAAKQMDPPERWFDFEGNLQLSPDARKLRCYGAAAERIVDKMTSPDAQDWYKHKQFQANVKSDIGSQDAYNAGSTMHGKMIKDKMTKPVDWFTHQAADQSNERGDSASVSSADYTEWRPPRTLGNGSDYAVRNIRGTSSDWILTHDSSYADERPAQRLGSRQAVANSDKHNGSNMKDCLATADDPQENIERPPQRIYKNAEANYIRNRGIATQLMTGEMEVEANLGTKNLVGELASTIAERHRGQLGSVLDHSSNQNYRESLPKPRAPTTIAQKQLERAHGTYDHADTSYCSPADDRKVHPRGLQGSATVIASKHKGSSMSELLSNYSLEPNQQPAQRIAGSNAQQNAARNAGTGWTLLAHDLGSAFESPPTRMPAAAQRVMDRQSANNISKTLHMMPPSARSDN